MLGEGIAGILLAFGIGVIAAVVNMVAGGGSALSLGLLMATGMPASMANGTNRLIVLVQSVTGATVLARRGRVPWELARACLPTALAGTAIGAWTASVMDPGLFERLLGFAFLGLAVLLILQMIRDRMGARPAGPPAPLRLRWWMHPAIFVAGLLAGFVQAGVGLVILLILHVLGRVEVVAANAVKIVLAVLFSVVSLGIFLLHGLVDWRAGVALAAGGWLGALLGVRLMLRLPAQAIRAAVVVFVVIAGIRLIF